MRTFPKELAAFRVIVKERGERLRQLPLAELRKLANAPVEEVVVNSRKAKIGTIVLPLPSGGVQIVIQGFLEHRFMPGKSVALDGFYKNPDQTVAPMESDDFSAFD